MDEGEDWLMRPVLRGVIPYAALDGPIEGRMFDLGDFVFVNEAFDVGDENQRRVNEYETAKRARNREKR